MKIVVGIVLIAIVIGALAVYLILMLNAHDMIFCGDITNEDGQSASVTRVYTTDLSANETLSQIVLAMNGTENDNLPIEELTVILAEYQSIIYAPVFNLHTEKVDTSTFIITGSVYNGINEKGEPTHNDYLYDNLRLNVVVANGEVLAAQNVYEKAEDAKKDKKKKDDDLTLVERYVIEPIITDENKAAAFALDDTDSFRMIIRGTAEMPAQLTFVYSYDVVTENPLDFTGTENGLLAISMTEAYDEEGRFDPEYELVKAEMVEDDKDKKKKKN
ncbi:MAG: hypothetical protein E7485_03440 [Ruminococcaceae bacterium]|nr:hypothetical protein [Oscillospiraceae bacterium]